ncbi:hypothetical protein GCM10009555_023120 [Acrocarpospora macrocephala]|uniref:Uncharacterized protein n=1 Tax=Acrocarpospora macrocephala TaxID=150177 RepID=A0A5M3WTM1_9ACTN|nr:hypothetical protein [Acrocarpospora macrocephala]GES12244.1 hypothetical protein Amac_058410 [Acrocarpospora macrocephala]
MSRVTTPGRWGLVPFGLALMASLAVAAQPVQAAGCATAGHVYVRSAAGLHQSGYEGNQQFGVPVVVLSPHGSLALSIGGNGLKKDTQIFYQITKFEDYWYTSNSFRLTGSNCVHNEVSIGSLSASEPGQYLLRASYTAGNTGAPINAEPVVLLVVPAIP